MLMTTCSATETTFDPVTWVQRKENIERGNQFYHFCIHQNTTSNVHSLIAANNTVSQQGDEYGSPIIA
jgi:heat shock protein HspQ